MIAHLHRPPVGAGCTGDSRRQARQARWGLDRRRDSAPTGAPGWGRDSPAISPPRVGAGCTGDPCLNRPPVGAGCTGDPRRQARQALSGLGRRRDSAPTGAPGWGRGSPAISPPRVGAGCTGDPCLLRPPVGAGCTGDLDTFSSHLLACHPELAPGRWRAYRRRDRWRGGIDGMRTTGGSWSRRAVIPQPRPRPGVRAPWQLIPWPPPLRSNRGSLW
jgi:hypothetical protein